MWFTAVAVFTGVFSVVAVAADNQLSSSFFVVIICSVVVMVVDVRCVCWMVECCCVGCC